jgi:hypothetical protein
VGRRVPLAESSSYNTDETYGRDGTGTKQMKFFALIFAVLAAVPQALKWMAYGFARMNDCTLPAKECLIKDNDQSEMLNKIFGPNWFTTTGLWIGIAGFVVFFGAMKVMSIIDDRKSRAAMNRADKQSGVGRSMGQGRHDQPRSDTYGRSPRPPAFDRYGRPRD